MNTYTKWFGRVVWIGVLVNMSLSVIAMFTPNWLLSLFGIEPAFPDVWLRFAGNLLILLSLFYIPAAINMYHYRANAWFCVVARAAGVIFFLCMVIFLDQQKEYLLFSLLDFTFGVPQGILLFFALRMEKQAKTRN